MPVIATWENLIDGNCIKTWTLLNGVLLDPVPIEPTKDESLSRVLSDWSLGVLRHARLPLRLVSPGCHVVDRPRFGRDADAGSLQ